MGLPKPPTKSHRSPIKLSKFQIKLQFQTPKFPKSQTRSHRSPTKPNKFPIKPQFHRIKPQFQLPKPNKSQFQTPKLPKSQPKPLKFPINSLKFLTKRSRSLINSLRRSRSPKSHEIPSWPTISPPSNHVASKPRRLRKPKSQSMKKRKKKVPDTENKFSLHQDTKFRRNIFINIIEKPILYSMINIFLMQFQSFSRIQ